MKARLPQLNLLVNKNKKSPEDSPSNFIHIVNGNAIVNNKMLVIVDIKEYIKRECGLSEDIEIEELNIFIEWLNKKTITAGFWKELTKDCFISVLDDKTIQLEYETFVKRLVYEESICNIQDEFDEVSFNLDDAKIGTSSFAVDGEQIALLMKTFAKELKSDSIVFQNTREGNPILFTLNKKDYISGYLTEDYLASTDIMNFNKNSELAFLIKNKFD